MRHGHRGAAEIAETSTISIAFAAADRCRPSAHFDLLFDATLGDERGARVSRCSANRQAAAYGERCFEEAAKRGFWMSRRNSSARTLARLKEAA